MVASPLRWPLARGGGADGERPARLMQIGADLVEQGKTAGAAREPAQYRKPAAMLFLFGPSAPTGETARGGGGV